MAIPRLGRALVAPAGQQSLALHRLISHDEAVGEAPGVPIRVRVGDDGHVELLEASPRTGQVRVTTRGLCPSAEHVFGLASSNRHRFVGTVSGSVSGVAMTFSDGSSRACDLRRIDGGDAQFFVVDLDASGEPDSVIAMDSYRQPLARLDLTRRLL